MRSLIKIFSSLLCRKFLLLGCLLVTIHSGSYSQEYLKNISNALNQGDASAVSAYFDKTVDITFSEESNTYSKKQAEIILQKFFSKVEPKQFQKFKSGDSKYNNTYYSIGRLSTSNGDYKIYLFFLQKKGIYYLKEMRFEK